MKRCRYVGDLKWVEGREVKHPAVVERPSGPGYTRQGVRDLSSFGSAPSGQDRARAHRMTQVDHALCDHRFECQGNFDLCDRCGQADECLHSASFYR